MHAHGGADTLHTLIFIFVSSVAETALSHILFSCAHPTLHLRAHILLSQQPNYNFHH